MNFYAMLQDGKTKNLKTVGDCLMHVRLNAESYGSKFGDIYMKLLGEWECVKFNSSLDESDSVADVMEFLKNKETLVDPYGGRHGEGVGWAPDGSFCGECGNITCKGCPSARPSEDVVKVAG